MLEITNLSKSFGQNKIINNLNLDVSENEFLVLLGPSGSGKTTFSRIIAGLESCDSGKIIFQNQDITKVDAKDRNLSMVFQNYALYPHKSVFDNIAFPLKINKHSQESIKNEVQSIAKKLGLENLLQRKPAALSGGQKQRVALARAMVKKPKIYIMDEPLSNLDSKLRSSMRFELAKVHKESKAIFIYVTHDQVEALSLGTKIIVLNEGEIQQSGSPDEIYNQPANTFVANFIGSPGANIFSSSKFPNHLIGIRPEFFELQESKNSFAIDLEIEHIENLGSQSLLYAKTEKAEKIVVKLDNEEASSLENISKVFCPEDKMYFFDKNGQRVAFSSNML